MTGHRTIAFALFTYLLSATNVPAQPGDRYLITQARVLDLVFPLDVTPKPYFQKLVLRYGDTNTQLVVVTYPGNRSELISYSLEGMQSDDDLSQMISQLVANNPDIKDREIVAKLRLSTTRVPIDKDALKPLVEELKSLRISPILGGREVLDGGGEYEFWCDTWHDSVHYSLTGPFNRLPQDGLVQWMIKFRTQASEWVKGSSRGHQPRGKQ